MIPKIINQIWIGPKSPPLSLIQTWRDKHPDWEHKLWMDHIGWENDRKIQEIPEWFARSDVMRYEILWQFGGVYIDADAVCLQKLDDSFLEHKNFACWENEIVRPGLIAAGYLGAERGSKFMRKCIDNMANVDLSAGMLWETVGPGFLTKMAKGDPDLFVYPAKTFIPMHFSGVPAPGNWPVYADQKWGTTLGYDKIS